jgi:3'(2'), 5'-bisphosphate nucleotidase
MDHLVDVPQVISLIIRAGDAVMDIYRRSFSFSLKEDRTPVTEADTAAHEILSAGLDPTYPVLSEEGSRSAFQKRRDWPAYWLVDPLDGTKEFISRNGEFTVNIALIADGEPAAGFVYAPAADLLYWAERGRGAYRIRSVSQYRERSILPEGEPLSGPAQKTRTAGGGVRITASRSHMSFETEQFVERVRQYAGSVTLNSSGSSLKLCRVAEGASDLYPRFGTTMEWDTAAADAVCRAAGCYVVSTEDLKPLRYNKNDLRNPWFLAGADPAFLTLLAHHREEQANE